MSFRLLPGVNRRAARQIVKDQIHPRQHFRQQDDLSGVHGEMLRHMKDRGEDPTDCLFEVTDEFLLSLPR